MKTTDNCSWNCSGEPGINCYQEEDVEQPSSKATFFQMSFAQVIGNDDNDDDYKHTHSVILLSFAQVMCWWWMILESTFIARMRYTKNASSSKQLRCDPGPSTHQQLARGPRAAREGRQGRPHRGGHRAGHVRHHGDQRGHPRRQRHHHPQRCQETHRRAEREEVDQAADNAGVCQTGNFARKNILDIPKSYLKQSSKVEELEGLTNATIFLPTLEAFSQVISTSYQHFRHGHCSPSCQSPSLRCSL